ncbi:hypothetical protein GTQ99_01395 [Kineococcus sp. T13]|uniref:hypothetical protein n=1 Tax=Kineococcus vitellinus TaxID=2696565 RepID=UPI0014134D3B|nr:hypothetical protein [Kineococcus vitellinus]NAZ74079.1 hypothetical protein [Kineococcus vitellinus]NAZ74086.1 hypothetical protein [Kineococcus vitellinus]
MIFVPAVVNRMFCFAGKSTLRPLESRAQMPAYSAVVSVEALMVVLAVAVLPLTVTELVALNVVAAEAGVAPPARMPPAHSKESAVFQGVRM